MLKNIKTSDSFNKQLAVLGQIVNNDALKNKDPKIKKKADTELIFVKAKNKTKKKN